MTIEQLKWIESNELIFKGNVSVSKEDAAYIYSIYNSITNQNKKPNGCGRCFASTKALVWAHYNRLNNLF